jgi:hypothetical protein
MNSNRIAKEGFYTSRTDLPYYQMTDNKLKKPVLNLPSKTDKIQIIQDLTNECLKYSSEEDNLQASNSSSGEPLNEEDMYEYLIEKVSTQNWSSQGSSNRANFGQINFNRDSRSLNPQTSFIHLPSTGGGDVRIRVNTSNFNRLIARHRMGNNL